VLIEGLARGGKGVGGEEGAILWYSDPGAILLCCGLASLTTEKGEKGGRNGAKGPWFGRKLRSKILTNHDRGLLTKRLFWGNCATE